MQVSRDQAMPVVRTNHGKDLAIDVLAAHLSVLLAVQVIFDGNEGAGSLWLHGSAT